jgi:hypothetical protein
MRVGLTLASVFFLIFFTVYLPSASPIDPDPNEVQIPAEIPCEIIENNISQITTLSEDGRRLAEQLWAKFLVPSWPLRIELVTQFVPGNLQRPPSHT